MWGPTRSCRRRTRWRHATQSARTVGPPATPVSSGSPADMLPRLRPALELLLQSLHVVDALEVDRAVEDDAAGEWDRRGGRAGGDRRARRDAHEPAPDTCRLLRGEVEAEAAEEV